VTGDCVSVSIPEEKNQENVAEQNESECPQNVQLKFCDYKEKVISSSYFFVVFFQSFSFNLLTTVNETLFDAVFKFQQKIFDDTALHYLQILKKH
jgi:hypothetical protein